MTMLKMLCLCIGLHFFADFTLQGILAELKQKSWWQKNYPEPLYRNDWLCGLIEHSLYWSLVVSAPIIWLWRGGIMLLFFSLAQMVVFHAIVDHLKANKKIINLTEDQAIHFLQIWILVCVWKAGC